MIKKLWVILGCLVLLLGVAPVHAEETANQEENKDAITLLASLQDFKIMRNSDVSAMSDLNLVNRIAKMDNNGRMEYISMMSIDGQIVYCIDVNVGAAFGGDYYEDYETLDWGTKERLWHLIYYGYGYPGHDSDDWFVATQLLVWDTIGQYVTPLNKDDGSFYDVEAQKAEILSLADNGGTLPSFNGVVQELNLNEQYTFEDSNNVLGQFPSPSNTGLEVSQDGNRLNVTITSLNYDGNLSSSVGGTDNPGIVYKKSNSQDVFLASRQQPGKSYSLQIKLVTGDLKIVKKDEYGNSAGAGHVFAIARDEAFSDVLGEYTTDTNGIALISGQLPVGDYYVKEKATIHPFVLNEEVFSLHIDANQTTTIELSNQYKTVGLKIIKTDEEDESIFLNDTLFSVTDISDVELESMDIYKLKLGSSTTLDKEGCSVTDTSIMSLTGTELTGIKKGKTTVVCGEEIDDYEVSDDFEKEFEKVSITKLDPNLANDENAHVVYMGMTGKNTIRLFDPSNHNVSLPATTIELFDEDDTSVGTFTSDTYGVVDISSTILEEGKYYYSYNDNKVWIDYKPITNGEISINGLKWGSTYMVCELSATEGYEVSGEACSSVTMNLDEGEEVLQLNPTNAKRRIDFQLYKIDANNSDRLKGAVFNVVNTTTGQDLGNFYSGYFYLKHLDADNNPQAGVIYEISPVRDFSVIVFTGATDANGDLVVDLNAAKYYARVKNEDNAIIKEVNVIEGGFEIKDVIWGQTIKVCEIEAPAGYELATACHEETINALVGTEIQMFDFADKKIVAHEEVPVMGI